MVSPAYHVAMSELSPLYTLIERIGNLLRNELRTAGAPCELEPVHWQALDYLGRANAYSNTPIAVADYLGLTKGNVSQRLIALERAGFIKRSPDTKDGRVSHLALTAKGRALLSAQVPPTTWREALGVLPRDTQDTLEQGLSELLRALQRSRNSRSFGVCHTCRLFQREGKQFRCGLTHEPLAEEQTRKICREHEVKTAA